MRYTKLILFLAAAHLCFISGAAVSDKSELEQLDGEQVRDLVVGNTYTFKTEWGRFASYRLADGTGYAKMWHGSGHTLSEKYEIKADGELCATFMGEPDWANGENEYCVFYYIDGDGNYYREVAADPNPEKVGEMKAFEIKPGDAFGLSE